jgi:hypothetical protein
MATARFIAENAGQKRKQKIEDSANLQAISEG